MLTGLIRPEDITQDNSIASSLIADAQVKYDGKGIVGDTQKMGFLTRIFRSIF
jgi:flagellar L-ring protein precursor FlgH